MFAFLATLMVGYYMGSRPAQVPDKFARSPYYMRGQFIDTCHPKIIGPGGENCTKFSEEDCEKYYVNNGDFKGNQFCQWSNGKCSEGFPCDLSRGYVQGKNFVPSCYPKLGGPNGKVCKDFNERECAIYYADNNGDQYCKWETIDRVGSCIEKYVCHD